MARYEADVVLGGPAPVVVALSGWWVRARCLVLAVDPASLRGWGLTARWAWETVHAWGVLDEADAAALQAAPRGLDLDRIALWPAGGPPGGPDSSHADTEVLERLCERALARQRSRARRAAVFVDRDGTLVVERGYLSDPADLELLPGAARALRQLKAGGFPVLVISNQSGVGRGLFPRTRVHEAMARLREQLRAEGVELDGIYFCPHRPEEGCSCRKPGTGLLEQAAEDQHLTLRASFMVGDKLLDVETGQRAGGLGVLVRSGYGREEERLLARGGSGLVPDLVCDDLEQAAHWILAQADPAGFG
jgi:D-glycero-D-manno-heptose 1,7-bisphosphate phosphatase